MSESSRAKIHGVPGERARAAGIMRAIWPLLAALFACGVFIGAALPQITPTAAGAGFLAAALFLVWSVTRGLRRVDAYFKGARGEERVAALLATLPRGYHVFHDFPGRGMESIDHVVAGPGGLFAVETKCWAGEVTLENGDVRVNGMAPSRPPIRQAQVSAQAMMQFLGDRLGSAPACVPVVCFASDTFSPGLATHEGTVICNAAKLHAQIMAYPEHFSSDEIERIVKVMEQKDP